MSRVVVITNPKASRAASRGLERAVTRLRARGVEAEVRPTQAAGHGVALARAAVAEGVETLVAHGGDGTIMEVAAGMVGSGRALGILPAGTGNRLAANLGISWDPLRAADIVAAGRRRTIDLGRMTTGGGGLRYFAVTAGCGFDAELMHHTSAAQKRLLGTGAYVSTAVRLASTLTRARVRVETDEGVHEGWAATVLVANCGGIVPFLPGFGPHIKPDDGLLDVILLDAATLMGATRVAWRLMVGRPGTDGVITYIRTTRARITTDPVMAAQADGDAAGQSPLEADLLPGGLTVLAP